MKRALRIVALGLVLVHGQARAHLPGTSADSAGDITVDAATAFVKDCTSPGCGITFKGNSANPTAPTTSGDTLIHCDTSGACYILTNGGTTPGDQISTGGGADTFAIQFGGQGAACQGAGSNYMGIALHSCTSTAAEVEWVAGAAWTPQRMQCSQHNDATCETLTFTLAENGTTDSACQIVFASGGNQTGEDSDCTSVGSILASTGVTVEILESGSSTCGTGISVACVIIGKWD